MKNAKQMLQAINSDPLNGDEVAIAPTYNNRKDRRAAAAKKRKSKRDCRPKRRTKINNIPTG